MFIAPSRFLLERYVDWGIPRDRILLEHHGFPPAGASRRRRGAIHATGSRSSAS